MFYVIKLTYNAIKDVFLENRDPRVKDWPLVSTPFPMITAIVLYLLFVNYAPKWMQHRKAYNLKNVMLIYNAIQVVCNLLILVVGLPNSYFRKDFSFVCEPVDHFNSKPHMQILLKATYVYYLTKYIDLLDTVFFVLRKKNNQITFLHVYHHAGMVFGVYIYMTFLPGSHSTMLGIINVVVHCVMYFYYLMTALRPTTKNLWWKKHITQLQLAQFGYLIIHFLMALLSKDCNHPMIISIVGFSQNLFMFALFFDFYYKAYIKRKSISSAGSKTTLETATSSNGQSNKCIKTS